MRRIPFVQQLETVECGAACLCMVLGAWGHHAPLLEVRAACGVARDGASAEAIIRAGQSFGLDWEGRALEVDDLRALEGPVILHWEMDHFIVFDRPTRKGIRILDPARGRRLIPWDRVGKAFTGIALFLEPGPGFKTRPKAPLSLKRYLHPLLRSRWGLFQALAATGMLQVLALLVPFGTQVLVDDVLSGGRTDWLTAIGIGLLAAGVGRLALTAVRQWVELILHLRVDREMVTGVVAHLMSLPVAFFMQRPSGDLLQRVQALAMIREFLLRGGVGLILDGATLVVLAPVMLVFSPSLGMLTMTGLALRVATVWLWRDQVAEIGAESSRIAGRLFGVIGEATNSLETIKAMGSEGFIERRWNSRSVGFANARMRMARIGSLRSAVESTITGLLQVCVIWLGGNQVIAGRMTLGGLSFFIALTGMILPAVVGLTGCAITLAGLRSTLDRTDDILSMAPEPSGGGLVRGGNQQIEVARITFSHSPGAPPAVEDVSLVVQPGETVAIVGPSGAGKSTLARLILGFHTPTIGAVKIGGKNLLELDPESVRRRMGTVLQETFLFDDTVAANLRMGREIGEGDLWWALNKVCLDEVIRDLPRGIETPIGLNGCRLSGGQRQRLAIARAILGDPAVLVLDEATSSLDLETEALVHANLSHLSCSKILIAHRIATIRDADRIVVMDQGRIVEQGRFDELSSGGGLFATLVAAMQGVTRG